MNDLSNIITENDFQIIGNNLYDENNLMRKSDLSLDEVNTCLISHVTHWIKEFPHLMNPETKKTYNRMPYIVEIMQYSAMIKESLSLSRKGRALSIFKDIMTTEVKTKRTRWRDKEESD